MQVRMSLTMVFLFLTTLVVAGVGTASAQDDEPELGWSETAELTVVFTGGNAEASTLGFRNQLARTWENATFVFDAGALRAESATIFRSAVGASPASFQVTKDSVSALTAESYYARGQYDRDINDARSGTRGPAGSATRSRALPTAPLLGAASVTRGSMTIARPSRRRMV